MKFIPRITRDDSLSFKKALDKIIRQEAVYGGKLFGPIPKNHDRQFFCLDEHAWVWHEVWVDERGKHSLTTRYEVRPNGVFKVQDGGDYRAISKNEAKNLLRATELYKNNLITRYQASLASY
jgi:hypothetical protein